ncbi:hypothetical protein P4679_25445 [Priestia megaterium]|uniref:hypothetical protein n=1 Tax=Priestia megaterium TaxID=1404 RepID=UPI002E1B9DD1|nr:hypothetical protein [Priestia megaterium]
MRKLPFIIGLVLMLALSACSNSTSKPETKPEKENYTFKIKEATAIITNDESLVGSDTVETKDGKKVEVVPTSLRYEFKLERNRSSKLLKTTKDKIELKIVPNQELLNASKKAVGFNLFDTDDSDLYGSGQGVSDFNSKGKGILDFTYILGANVDSQEIPKLPSKDKLNDLKENALKGTLIVLKNDKEIARFNLNGINKID